MPSRRKRSRRRAALVGAALAGKRGPEPSVTLAVVARVGQRMAKGLPLHYALALEDDDISIDAWHKALQRDAKLSTHLNRWKAKFIEESVTRLADGEMADLKWLLSRRHPELFAEREPEAKEGPAETAIAGMQELIRRSRELAKLKQGEN